jgi:hypothetical protein
MMGRRVFLASALGGFLGAIVGRGCAKKAPLSKAQRHALNYGFHHVVIESVEEHGKNLVITFRTLDGGDILIQRF